MATEADCTPLRGQLLAGRYRLEEQVASYTSNGNRLWRGLDQLLARPVAVKVQDRGGDGAEELLAAAVSSGRVAHPHIASVYDAATLGNYAYVVSEWVDGEPLTALLSRDGPLDPGRAAALVGSAADAVSALHALGLCHGNLHPDNVLVTTAGDIKLTDLHSGTSGGQQDDVRALGALLYASLTGRWPGPLEVAEGPLPPAPYADGHLCSPRQVRAGAPSELSRLAMAALATKDTKLTAPGFALELARRDYGTPPATLPEVEEVPEPGRRSAWRRLGLPVAIVLAIAAAGWVAGVRLGAIPAPPGIGYPSFRPGAKGGPSAAPTLVAKTLGVVGARVLDPQGDGTELKHADRAYDGRADTAWKTDSYTNARFGNLKQGMGLLFDLGSPTKVGSVTVTLGSPGATVELRAGDVDGRTASDFTMLDSDSDAGTSVQLTPVGNVARYWLVWITQLPRQGGGYEADVAEVRFAR